MIAPRAHHAALWLCVDNSSSDNGTPRSAAILKRGICQRPGIDPRLPHISIAFSETLNRLESSSAPPSFSTIMDVPFMGESLGTPCSSRQELLVPFGGPGTFQPDDTSEVGWNPHRMAHVRTLKDQGAIAFTRFETLMQEMGWDDDWAIRELVREIADPLNMGKKAVEQWFQRKHIPPEHIFNLGAVLGIAPGWLTDQTHFTKEEAIAPGGLYAREVERAARHKRA